MFTTHVVGSGNAGDSNIVGIIGEKEPLEEGISGIRGIIIENKRISSLNNVHYVRLTKEKISLSK